MGERRRRGSWVASALVGCCKRVVPVYLRYISGKPPVYLRCTSGVPPVYLACLSFVTWCGPPQPCGVSTESGGSASRLLPCAVELSGLSLGRNGKLESIRFGRDRLPAANTGQINTCCGIERCVRSWPMTPTRQGSFRLFHFAGIDVYLHWSWFLIAVYGISLRVGRYSSMVWPVLEYLALFLIVLVHEFGHALACRQVGGQANQ